MGDWSLTGELTSDLADTDDVGDLAGAGETGDGEEWGSWTAAGEEQTGVFADGGGEEAVLSALVSSGRKGSEKKRALGDFSKPAGYVRFV